MAEFVHSEMTAISEPNLTYDLAIHIDETVFVFLS